MTDECDPDAELLVRIGQGEEAAFRRLIAAKLSRVHSLARRMLSDAGQADDVAQETFLRVWRHAPSWHSGPAKFDTWLHRVVLNLCRDRLRLQREQTVVDLPDQADPAPRADAKLEREEMAQRIRTAISTLPTRQCEAIMLQTYQELSNIETAAVMGVSVEALESLLARGRRTLRRILMEDAP